MKRVVLLAAILLCSCGDSKMQKEVDGHVGLDVKAIMHPDFPCDGLVGLVGGRALTIAVLFRTFGESHHCLSRIIKPGDTIIWQLLNGPCRRNKRCEPTELLWGNSVDEFNRLLESKNETALQLIRFRLMDMRFHMEYYPQATHKIVPELEDNLTPKAADVLINEVMNLFNGVIIRNPLRGSDRRRAEVIETHNEYEAVRPPCIYSNDGGPLSINDFSVYAERGCELLMWVPQFNCLEEIGFKPIKDRRCALPSPTLAQLSAASELIF